MSRSIPLGRNGRGGDPSDQPDSDRMPLPGSCLRSPCPSRIHPHGARPGPRTTSDGWAAPHIPTQATRTPAPRPRSAWEDPPTLRPPAPPCQPGDDLRRRAYAQVTRRCPQTKSATKKSRPRRVATRHAVVLSGRPWIVPNRPPSGRSERLAGVVGGAPGTAGLTSDASVSERVEEGSRTARGAPPRPSGARAIKLSRAPRRCPWRWSPASAPRAGPRLQVAPRWPPPAPPRERRTRGSGCAGRP
jgi:hypothetical protein